MRMNGEIWRDGVERGEANERGKGREIKKRESETVWRAV